MAKFLSTETTDNQIILCIILTIVGLIAVFTVQHNDATAMFYYTLSVLSAFRLFVRWIELN